MRVGVQLHTILQRQTPHGQVSHMAVELPPQSDLQGLLQELGIEFDIDELLLVVNGRSAEPGQVLQDGDEVHLIPAISGG